MIWYRQLALALALTMNCQCRRVDSLPLSAAISVFSHFSFCTLTSQLSILFTCISSPHSHHIISVFFLFFFQVDQNHDFCFYKTELVLMMFPFASSQIDYTRQIPPGLKFLSDVCFYLNRIIFVVSLFLLGSTSIPTCTDSYWNGTVERRRS